MEHHHAAPPESAASSPRGYVQEATEAYFGDTSPITPEQLRQAAAGLIALLLLGGLIVSRIL